MTKNLLEEHYPSVRSWRWWLVVSFVAATALTACLVPLLKGAGLLGLGNYDDAVYYAAAINVAHGYLPYRDFLLLHPPGIVLALTPFALIGRLTNEHDGFALARLAWMALGAVNAVLVSRILRPIGLAGALLGGLCYALLYPAVDVEWTTQLQGLANTCLLLAMVLLSRNPAAHPASTHTLLLAGALLGASATVKVWGVATVLLAVSWLLVVAGLRAAGRLLAGALAGTVVVCLPFFLAAPTRMWAYVVAAQLHRQETGSSSAVRVADITGAHLYHVSQLRSPLLVVVCAVVALVTVLAWREEATRLAVVLLIGLTLLLLATPSWFGHYAALTAPPLAVVFGSGTQHAINWIGLRYHSLQVLSMVGLTVVLAAYAFPLTQNTFGRPFPGAVLSKAVRGRPGCVVADNQAALIAMDLVGRNLDRKCAPIVDLAGYSYVLARRHVRPLPRSRDSVWQQFTLARLASANAVILTNYRVGHGLSSATRQRIKSWPVLARAGRYQLRTPVSPRPRTQPPGAHR